jgi:hypothetical protein
MLHYALFTLLVGSFLLTVSLVGVSTNHDKNVVSPASVSTSQDIASTEKERFMTNARRYLPNRAQQEALIYELQQRESDYDSTVPLLKKYITREEAIIHAP